MPALLFEVKASSVGLIVEYPTSTGFAMSPESITPGPNGTVRLCLILTDPNYRDQFCALTEDVLSVVVQSAVEEDAVTAILARLSSWQNFMRRHSEGLSIEEQTGLFAELLYLMRVLHPMHGHAALNTWKGPIGGLWDFVTGDTAIELKATTASGSKAFHVSHLGQLDANRVGHLLVCFQTLVQSIQGASLVELVASARLLFGSGPAGSQFQLLLLAAGYSDVHALKYQTRKLALQSLRHFRVTEGFPRLTREIVPLGIIDALYEVDLEACLPYEITESVALNLISSLG